MPIDVNAMLALMRSNPAEFAKLMNAGLCFQVYYEAGTFPEHWQAIANVWFNRLADSGSVNHDF